MTRSNLENYLVIFSTVLFCGISAMAYPGHPLRLQQLVDAANIIAVVDITNVQKTGQIVIGVDSNVVRANTYTSAARILRIIKGYCPDEISIESYAPLVFVGIPEMVTGVQMVFLKTENDRFVFADPHYPSLPALPSSTPQPGMAAADPLQMVVGELGGVIASPAEPEQCKWAVFRIVYAIPTSDAFIANLRKGLDTADVDLRYRIESELILRDDLSTLPNVEKSLLANYLPAEARKSFLFVISWRLNDPRAVPTLSRLLHSGDTEIRKAAAEGLWHIGAPSSLPDLVRALRDSDQEVRFYAVRGLSDIGKEPGWGGLSEKAFEEHEDKYVQHWLEWAQSQP